MVGSPLVRALAAEFPQHKFRLVNAEQASACVGKVGASSEDIVLDHIASFDGLERLVVVCVALDEPIGGAHAPSLRSKLYRAMTRAQMLLLIVNELLAGGALEFLAGGLRLRDGERFDLQASKALLDKDASVDSSAVQLTEVHLEREHDPKGHGAHLPSSESTIAQRHPPLSEDALPSPTADDISTLSHNELKALIIAAGLSFADCIHMDDLQARARVAKESLPAATMPPNAAGEAYNAAGVMPSNAGPRIGAFQSVWDTSSNEVALPADAQVAFNPFAAAEKMEAEEERKMREAKAAEEAKVMEEAKAGSVIWGKGIGSVSSFSSERFGKYNGTSRRANDLLQEKGAWQSKVPHAPVEFLEGSFGTLCRVESIEFSNPWCGPDNRNDNRILLARGTGGWEEVCAWWPDSQRPREKAPWPVRDSKPDLFPGLPLPLVSPPCSLSSSPALLLSPPCLLSKDQRSCRGFPYLSPPVLSKG